MASHTWNREILFPLWLVELIWLVFTIALAGLGKDVVRVGTYWWDITHYLEQEQMFGKVVIALIAFCAAIVAMTLTTIGLFTRGKLSPKIYLTCSCIKTAFSTAYFFFNVASETGIFEPPLELMLSGPLFLTTLGQLIYGSIIMRRVRKKSKLDEKSPGLLESDSFA